MKKNVRKVLAAILTLVMIFGTFSFAVLAADTPAVPQYGKAGGYLAIGDSISRGCGCDGFYMDTDKASGGQYDLYEMRNVQGSLPYQIAQAVGCTAPVDMEDRNATYWPFCYPGMTLGVAMDLLGIEDNFKDTALDYPYYDSMLKYFGNEKSFDGVRGETYVDGECGLCGDIDELIKSADLITVQLGMCDIFYRAYRIALKGGSLALGADFDLSDTDALKELAVTAVKEMTTGFEYWKAYYPVLIQYLKELNPDADIVMVGSFNVVNQLTISDEYAIPIGSAISLITEGMNKKYVEWADEFDVLYADVSNTETLTTESDWALLGDFMDNTFTGTHPTQKGYDYMVRQILNLLVEKQDNGKNIVVDIARFNNVDYVLVDGKRVTGFTMNGYVLTVPYTQGYAKNLTIGIKNDNGTISAQTYKLSYNQTDGYTAERIFGSNDVFGAIKNFFLMIKNLFMKLLDLF